MEEHRHQSASSPSANMPSIPGGPGQQGRHPQYRNSPSQYSQQMNHTMMPPAPSMQSHPEQAIVAHSAQQVPPVASPPTNVQYRSVYQQQRNNPGSQSEIQAQPISSRMSQQQNSAPASTGSASGAQRLDSLLMINSKTPAQPPQPPERKSSYEITAELSPNNQNSQNKKVSFTNPEQEVSIKYDSNGNQENIKDSNYSPCLGESMITPPTSPPSNFIVGNTPGVIGAQEVYRDPRKQIQEQRVQHLSRNNRGPGPEELSFKDKMKKFALEAGQPESPRDKVKISRAQRDIENKVNGAP